MTSTGQVVPAITPVRRLSSLNWEKLQVKTKGGIGRLWRSEPGKGRDMARVGRHCGCIGLSAPAAGCMSLWGDAACVSAAAKRCATHSLGQRQLSNEHGGHAVCKRGSQGGNRGDWLNGRGSNMWRKLILAAAASNRSSGDARFTAATRRTQAKLCSQRSACTSRAAQHRLLTPTTQQQVRCSGLCTKGAHKGRCSSPPVQPLASPGG